MQFPISRPRRLRQSATIRRLVRETSFSPSDIILPLFIKDHAESKPIKSMPGHYQLALQDLPAEIKTLKNLGVSGVLLFGIPSYKDEHGSESYQDSSIIQRAILTIKETDPNFYVATDVCFCEYTSHGHCGALDKNLDVDNDATLELLQKQALNHVRAGADMVAPSGMTDGMVQAIRSVLDSNQYHHIPIMSYAVKYASAFYGPFRDAAEGAPQMGDRKSYQMDPANHYEALREAEQDLQQGADILMVKPAMVYLDVLFHLKQKFPGVPLAAYQVSGEFAMLKAAAQQGWINEQAAVLESLTAIKRAGANFIISYYAKEVAEWLR